MAKKARLSNAQKAVLKSHKMIPLFWTVMEELDKGLIVKHRITGEFRVIGK